MSNALSNLAKIRQLKQEPASETETQRLLEMATRHLQDAQQTSVSVEGRFLSAYSAAHATALAALRWHGFRSENRYTVFQVLEHTVGWPAAQWRQLDHAHNQRNLAEYEGYLEVESSEVENLILLATELLADVRNKIKI